MNKPRKQNWFYSIFTENTTSELFGSQCKVSEMYKTID